MTALAGLAGAAVIAGLLLIAHEVTRQSAPGGKPPRRRALADAVRAGTARTALGAAAAGLAVLLVSGWPVAAIAAAAAVIFVPKLGIGRGQRRQITVLEGLDQWTRWISDMLTAGRTVEDAVASAAANAPAAVAEPAAALARRLRGQAGTEAALRAFADEINDPAGDRVAAALIIATSARGGRVRNVLNALADLMARDVDARRQTEAERAQHRTNLRWITVFICGYAVFSLFLNRSYSAPFGTPAGQVVLAVIALLDAGGLAWLHHLNTMPARGRFVGARRHGAEPAHRPAFWGIR